MFKTTATGNGNVEVLIRVKKDDTWSAFTSLAAAEGADADAVQFRVHYQVTKVNNVDSAKVNKITMRYTTGAAKVSGDVAELYSTVQNYGADLSTAILSIRHKPLADSIIKAYVNFLSPTKRRTLIDIGTASGSSEQFILGVDGVRDTGIDQSSIRLFADGQPLLNFSYNTEVSEVTVNATAGKTITASYEYDHEPEVWHEMSCEVNQQPYDDGSVQSRYIYSLGDDERGLQVTNIRINMFRTSGYVDEEILGVGTGGVQMFVLKHAAKEDTINCNAEWAYNADSQIITCVAPVGTKIVAAYDRLGEQHVLYSWTAGFTAAL